MRFNILNRKVHYWISFAAAVPLLVMTCSGLLLQSKKHWTWVQPFEHRAGTVPIIDLNGILASVQSVAHLDVTSWDDVNRLDVRPGRGMVRRRQTQCPRDS